MTIGDGKTPFSRDVALFRMNLLATVLDAEYQMGTGNYNAASYDAATGTMLVNGFKKQYDCAGAVCEALGLTRHRKGFAPGKPKFVDQNDVDDDINTNSMIEDAYDHQDVFVPVLEGMQAGDLVMWATITLHLADGTRKVFIGHVLMASFVPHGWKVSDGFHACRFLQCKGGNGRKPAVVETDGSVIDHHNSLWPKPAHRAHVVTVKGWS